VAIDAFGSALASGGEFLAVDAVGVFGILVGGQLGIIFGHVVGVGMAFGAIGWDARALDADFEAAGGKVVDQESYQQKDTEFGAQLKKIKERAQI